MIHSKFNSYNLGQDNFRLSGQDKLGLSASQDNLRLSARQVHLKLLAGQIHEAISRSSPVEVISSVPFRFQFKLAKVFKSSSHQILDPAMR